MGERRKGEGSAGRGKNEVIVPSGADGGWMDGVVNSLVREMGTKEWVLDSAMTDWRDRIC